MKRPDFQAWSAFVKRYVRWNRLLTPLFVSNTLERIEGTNWIGYRRYYVFGILVAQLQQTVPWNKLK
jgi:hypothetical protein